MGGLKMPNVKLKDRAWKFTWLKRAVVNPDLSYVHIIDDFLSDLQFTDLICCRLDNKASILSKLPKFYTDILLE